MDRGGGGRVGGVGVVGVEVGRGGGSRVGGVLTGGVPIT